MTFKSNLVLAGILVGCSGFGWTQATPATAIDLGALTIGNSPLNITIPTYAAASLRWYRFSIATPVSASSFEFLDIYTSSAGTSLDTELGIYTTAGALVSSDDDDGDDYFSMMSFGVGGGGNGNGQSGAILAAATYYIVTGRYDTIFNGSSFNVTSSGPANTAPYFMTLRRGNNAPIPAQRISGVLNLNDTVSPFAVDRLMTYTVRQGTTTVGSGAILAAHASTPFTIEVDASILGAVSIWWDGGSCVRQTVAANLNGTSTVMGTVSVTNGDVDNSGEVDAGDIDLVISQFGQNFPGGLGNGFTDVDCSGEVDAGDIDIVIANFGAVNN